MSICRTTCTTAVRRFLDRIKPRLAVIMETEIWPNLFMTCADRDIAIVIANARLSEKSLRGYWPIQPLARRAIRCASFIAAQSTSDNERLHALGAPTERLAVVGNLKFDMSVPADVVDLGREFRASAGARSSGLDRREHARRRGDVVLKAHAEVLRRFPDALLLVAPRHPERFKALATACHRRSAFAPRRAARTAAPIAPSSASSSTRSASCCASTRRPTSRSSAAASCRSAGTTCSSPRRSRVPVIVGPQTFNFAEVTEDLIKAGAALRIPDGDALGPAVVRLLSRDIERRTMGEAAHRVDGTRARRRGADDGDRRARSRRRVSRRRRRAARADQSSSALISCRSLTSITPAACFNRRPSMTNAWRAVE